MWYIIADSFGPPNDRRLTHLVPTLTSISLALGNKSVGNKSIPFHQMDHPGSRALPQTSGLLQNKQENSSGTGYQQGLIALSGFFPTNELSRKWMYWRLYGDATRNW
jgi:hypothetical protein